MPIVNRNQLADILPHANPMILIDDVISFNAEDIHTMVTIRADAPFCHLGRVPAYVAIEYMAQSIAAWHSLNAKLIKDKPKIGFLLGTRSMQLAIDHFTVGTKLAIFCKSVYSHEGMAAFECYVEYGGSSVAQATINLYQPQNITEYFEVPQ